MEPLLSEQFITDKWFVRLAGSFFQDQVRVVDGGAIDLSPTVAALVESSWRREVKRVRKNLLSSGVGRDHISVRQEGGLDAIYISVDGRDVPVLFSGPAVRIDDISLGRDGVRARHSATSYAVRRLMSRLAYRLIDEGGLRSVVDCASVSVILTTVTGESESICLFRRSKHLTEGGGLWGFVAGGIESPKTHVFDAGVKEMREEVSLVPVLASAAGRSVGPDRSVPGVRSSGGSKREQHEDAGPFPSKFRPVEPIQLLGLITDISVDGQNHNFKSEYVILARSRVGGRQVADWVRTHPAGELEEVRFLPFDADAIQDELLEIYDDLTPPTSAALSLCMLKLGGISRFRDHMRRMAELRPIPRRHPFHRRVSEGQIRIGWHEIGDSIWAELRDRAAYTRDGPA